MVLYCRACGDGYGSTGERPKVCPSCFTDATVIAPTELWTETPPWRVGANDRRFLRSLKIDPEQTPDDDDNEDDMA